METFGDSSMKQHCALLFVGCGLFFFGGMLVQLYLSSGVSVIMGTVAVWLACEGIYWQGRQDALKDVTRIHGEDWS